MTRLTCTNDECGREWDYTGDKSHPAYVNCPTCYYKVQLPEEDGES